MLPKMNGSAAPCGDFWNYACGGWLKEHPTPPAARSTWDQAEEMAFKSREKIRSIVTTLPHPTKDSSIEWKVKRLYESCMALDTIESDRYTPLRKIINILGGWGVLREFSILSWDYRLVLQQLHASYGVSPFFKVSPSGLGLPGRSYYYRLSDSPPVIAYKRYLRDAVQLLGATSIDAERFSDETFHFEKRIAEVTPDPMEMQDPLSFTITTVEELKQKAPSAMFPRANIGDKTEVLMPSENYITKVSSILSTTDRESLNNYLTWVLAKSYLPYMSEEIRATVNYYNKEMTGATAPLQRWEMCVNTLQRFMGFGLAVLQQQAMEKTERHAARNVVNEMFSLTREIIRKRIEEASWLELELKSLELDKIDTLDLQVGFTEPVITKEYLERYYAKLFVQKNDFFQNILYGVEFLREKQQERLVSTADEHRWLDVMSGNRGPAYVSSANKIVVPLHFLVPPIFHPQYPISVLYGGLGVQLASAIVSSVLPWHIYYGSDGKLLTMESIAVNQSLLAHQRPVTFITNDLVQNAPVSELVANRTALSMITQISAVRQAHLAMKQALSELPHTHQPAMETLESDAIFFLTYAQTICSVSTLEKKDQDQTIGFQLKGSKLLRTSLKQVKLFTEAFSCQRESSYFASNICKETL
ncbi:hypothetical protein C0J52_08789 [Blattella germanica]|nr:hypothetical protein C0J52_08789 [Blattella germanica]